MVLQCLSQLAFYNNTNCEKITKNENAIAVPPPYHETPVVGVSRPRSWSRYPVFVRNYRQKLTNLLEIDF